jgi:hypothetical protein
MSEVSNDESRLHATEAQMRRALGLQDTPSPKPQSGLSAPPPSYSHRGPRHFVRDGEVPVTVTHREETGTNQLDVARRELMNRTRRLRRRQFFSLSWFAPASKCCVSRLIAGLDDCRIRPYMSKSFVLRNYANPMAPVTELLRFLITVIGNGA